MGFDYAYVIQTEIHLKMLYYFTLHTHLMIALKAFLLTRNTYRAFECSISSSSIGDHNLTTGRMCLNYRLLVLKGVRGGADARTWNKQYNKQPATSRINTGIHYTGQSETDEGCLLALFDSPFSPLTPPSSFFLFPGHPTLKIRFLVRRCHHGQFELNLGAVWGFNSSIHWHSFVSFREQRNKIRSLWRHGLFQSDHQKSCMTRGHLIHAFIHDLLVLC